MESLEEDPLEMNHNLIVQFERDWTEDGLSAVIFVIVCGWHEVLPEIAEKFAWSEKQLARLTWLGASCVQLWPTADYN
jgi:hypothetical protein